MAEKSIFYGVARILLAALAVTALAASEHHGTVMSGGVPVPGATVTATQGDKKVVTTTDDQGVYSFPELADGIWSIQVDMLGFEKLTSEVGIAPAAPSPVWDIKLLSLSALKQALAAQSAAAAPPPAPAPVTAAAPSKPAPSTPTAPAAARTTASAAAPAAGRGGRGGRGAAANTSNGRPSLRGAIAQNGYQRLNVEQSANADVVDTNSEPANDGAAAMPGAGADSADALSISGSLSSGVNMPQQNDWFGFGGRGGMGGGFGGPGGDLAAMDGGPGGPGGGGPGGPGGPGGGPGGRGGARGGGGGGGMPAGFGGGRGGRGGGGRGGRGGPANRQNQFGNGRRDRRMQYNGNVAVILDNSVLDARPFSLTGQDTPKAAYNHLRSTGMFGGPLKIPHVLSGQRTFFTINYQLTRNRNASTSTSLMPTAAERAGDFSSALNAVTGAPVTVYDPLSGSPFPGNQIPQNRLSASALALLGYYPQPNFTGSNRYNFQIPIVGKTSQSNINSRISQTLNARNQIAGTFAYQTSQTTSANLFNFIDTTAMTGINTGVNWAYHFTARLINNVRYNFSRSATTTTPFFEANNTNVSGLAGIEGNEQSPAFYGPPSLNFSSGFATLSDGAKQLNHNNTSQVGDSLLWVHGQHNITSGMDFRRLDFNGFSQQNPRGSFSFNGGLTSQIGSDGLGVTGTGFDFADFLLGYPATSSIAYGNADKYFRASWLDAYVTDDWRVSTKLSLNLGVRWDYQAPVTELYNRLVNLDIGPGYSTATPVCGAAPSTGLPCTLASSVGFPNAMVRPNYHEFQPRLGFAWRPPGKGSMVVRGGYGIYYNTSVYQPLANQMAQQSPLSTSVTQSNSLVNPYSITNAFTLPAVSATAQTFGLDPNFHIGYLHYWQLAVQRNLPWSMVATVTYNGNKGTHQVQQFLPNTYPAGVPASDYPHGFAYETSNANSHYEAFIAQLQRRFRSGFSGNLVYVHSQAIDNSQSLGGRGGGGGGSAYAQNWLDLNAEKSVSAFNRPNTFNINMQFSTGMGARGGALVQGFKGTLLKDWTFQSGITLGSGLPETPLAATRIAAGTGITGTTRADYLGGSLAAVLPGYGFNTAIFGTPPAGQWGDAGRAIITGPAQFGLNAAASRVFRIGERRSADIRFDATNLLNHVVYSSWNTTVGSAQFGLPTGANAMRTFQVTLRFRF